MTDTTIDTIEAQAEAMGLRRADRLPFDWCDQAYDLLTAVNAYKRRLGKDADSYLALGGYVYVWRAGE